MELWPIPLLHFTTFQFIYAWIPRPTVDAMFALQMIVVGCCTLGIVGIKPRWCAGIAFVLALHITGMMQASNSEVDGGSLALCAILVLVLSPSESFYRLGHKLSLSRRKVCSHWPAFLLMLITGTFYSMAGLNKIVDVGPHWPLVLHLENLATYGIENSLFLADRYAHPGLCSWNVHPAWSYIAALVTLVAEVGFLAILFVPRYRLALVISLCVFHVLVFAMAGINFVGSSLILLLCLDWNALLRQASLIYNGESARWLWTTRLWGRLNWLGSLRCETVRGVSCETFKPSTSPSDDWLLLIDENGEVYSGLQAVEQACTRCPLLWAVALLLKVPGVYQCASPVFDRRSGLVPPPADVVERSLYTTRREAKTVCEMSAAA
jgi:hypothetical protein